MNSPRAVSAAPAPGFGHDLVALFWDPAAAFRRVAAVPRVYWPLGVFVAQQLAFTAVWLGHMNMVAFLRHEASAAGQPPPDPASVSEGFYRGLFWLSAVTISPGALFLIAGICMLTFNALAGLRIAFRESLSVVLHAFVTIYFVYLPLTLLVMALRGDWNVAPEQVLQANLAALLDRESIHASLYALADSLDLFSFWTLALLATGYRAVARRSVTGLLVGLWLLWVLIRAAFAALAA